MPTFRPIALTVATLTALTACHPGGPLPAQVVPGPPPPAQTGKPGDPAADPARNLKIAVTLPAGVHQRLQAQRRMGIQGMAGRATFGIRTNFLAEVGNSDSARRLMALGIIQGNGPNSIDWGNSISRAEFVTVMVRAFGQESTAALVNSAPAFADASMASHWAAGYAAVAKNLVQGAGGATFSPPSTFVPNGQPTSAEALALIANFLGHPLPNPLPPVDNLIQSVVGANRQGGPSLPDSLMASDLLNVLAPTLIQGGSSRAQLDTLLASFPDPMIFELTFVQAVQPALLDSLSIQDNGDLTYLMTMIDETLDAAMQQAADRDQIILAQINNIHGQTQLLGTIDPNLDHNRIDTRSTAEALLAQALQQRQNNQQNRPANRPRPTTIDRQHLQTVRDQANRAALDALSDRIANNLRSSSGVPLQEDPRLNTLLDRFATTLADRQPLTPQVVAAAQQVTGGGGGGGSSSSGHTLATNVTVTNGSHGAGEDWDNPPD